MEAAWNGATNRSVACIHTAAALCDERLFHSSTWRSAVDANAEGHDQPRHNESPRVACNKHREASPRASTISKVARRGATCPA